MLRGIIRNSLYGTVGQIVSMCIAVISSVVLARGLGVEGRGMYAMILLLQSTLSTLACAGILPSLVHTVAAKRWKRDQYHLLILPLFVLAVLLLFLVGLPFLLFRNLLLPSVTLTYALIAILMTPLSVLQSMLVSVIAGQQKFKLNANLNVLFSLTSLALILYFVWFADMYIAGAVLSQFLVLLVSITVLAHFGDIRFSRGFASALDRENIRKLMPVMAFGAKSHIANVATFLNYKADQFIINAVVGTSGVGIYSVAVANSEKLHLLSGNIGGVMLSVSSAEPGSKDTAKAVADLSSCVFYIMIFVCALIALFIKDAVVILYGEDFHAVGDVILYLLPGIVFLSHAKILANYLSGSGFPGVTGTISVLALGCNILLNLFMIPAYGITGAAISTVFSYLLIDVLCCIFFVKLTRTKMRELCSIYPLPHALRMVMPCGKG